MPYALDSNQRAVAEALFSDKTPLAKVAETIKCSISQVKKISSNWHKYRSLVASGFKKWGRRPIMDTDIIDVIAHTFELAINNFRFWLSLLRISLIYIVTKWPISSQRSSVYQYLNLRLIEYFEYEDISRKKVLLTSNI